MITYAATIPFAECLFTDSSDIHLRTTAAIEQIGEALVQSDPDVLVFVATSHHKVLSSFSIQLEKTFTTKGSLKSCGIIDAQTLSPAIDIIARIQSRARAEHVPVITVQEEVVTSNIAGAFKLLRLPTNLPVCIIETSNQSALAHAEFGYLIKDVLQHTDKRIAVISVGTAPITSATPEQFQSAVVQRSVAVCNQIMQNTKEQTVINTLALTAGILRGFPTLTRLLSYETEKDSQMIAAILFSD